MRTHRWFAVCAAALVTIDTPAGIAAQADLRGTDHNNGTDRASMPLPPQSERPPFVPARKPDATSVDPSAPPNGAMERTPGMPPARNVERAITDVLAPPRQQCAALRAAISQAVMDRSGRRDFPPPPGVGRYPGMPAYGPEATGGRPIDKRARLESEYAQLGCSRVAP